MVQVESAATARMVRVRNEQEELFAQLVFSRLRRSGRTLLRLCDPKATEPLPPPPPELPPAA